MHHVSATYGDSGHSYQQENETFRVAALLIKQTSRKLGWIGIDVGGTKTRFDLFDDGLRLVHSITIKTDKDVEDLRRYSGKR